MRHYLVRDVMTIDHGSPPVGIEREAGVADRYRLLRATGYKL